MGSRIALWIPHHSVDFATGDRAVSVVASLSIERPIGPRRPLLSDQERFLLTIHSSTERYANGVALSYPPLKAPRLQSLSRSKARLRRDGL